MLRLCCGHLCRRPSRRLFGEVCRRPSPRLFGTTTTGEVSVSSAAMHRSIITQELWGLRTEYGKEAPPPPNADGTRHPSHARVAIRYALSTDGELRNRYESAFGTMRLGVLLEDMDALAGSVAWRYVDDADPSTDPPVLVTASVDEIDVFGKLPLDEDYEMSGEVVWAGTSSLVIVVDLKKLEDGVALRGVFTYVARRGEGGPEKVYALVPETPLEKERYSRVAEQQQKRKEQRKKKAAATTHHQRSYAKDERKIAKLLEASRVARDFPGQADDGLVAMNRTSLRSAQMCHPQERNTAGNVFGGVLLRRALEHAFATAFTFAGAEPRMAGVQRVDFLKPVHVGSLLALTSIITYTENPPPEDNDKLPAFVHVSVQARTWMPETCESILNNTFVFVFCVDPPLKRPLKKVFPTLRTEAELVVHTKPRYKTSTHSDDAHDDDEWADGLTD